MIKTKKEKYEFCKINQEPWLYYLNIKNIKKIRKTGTLVILHSTWDLFCKTNDNGNFAFSSFAETVILFLQRHL